MVAALPRCRDRVDDCTVPAHDDLRECRAKDTLARSGGCSGMQPGALQIEHRAPSIAGAPARRAATDDAQSGRRSAPSTLATACNASFQRRPARRRPGRFAGSTASYCRRACAASVACMLRRQPQLALGRGRRSLDCASIALSAASMPSGFRTRRGPSLLIAASMLKPPIENAARGAVVRARTAGNCSGRSCRCSAHAACGRSGRTAAVQRAAAKLAFTSLLRERVRCSCRSHCWRLQLEALRSNSSQVM